MATLQISRAVLLFVRQSAISLCAMALTTGGNIRVGLADRIYAGKGVVSKTNAEQGERIVAIGRQLSLVEGVT